MLEIFREDDGWFRRPIREPKKAKTWKPLGPVLDDAPALEKAKRMTLRAGEEGGRAARGVTEAERAAVK